MKAAKERARIRDELLVEMTTFIDRLETAADEAAAMFADAHYRKNEKRREVLQKSLELCEQRTHDLDAPGFMDCMDDNELQAEKESDAAVTAEAEQQALNSKLQQQLSQFQQAAAAAATEANQKQQQQQQQQQAQHAHQQQLLQQHQQQQQVAAAAAAALAAEARAESEWLTDFPVEESQLPPLPTTQPDEQQTAFILRLLTLKQAAKFASLPRMSFQRLEVPPWFVHRLVGDTIWGACWAERAPNVAADATVPQKLLYIATHVVSALEQEYSAKATEEHKAAAARTINEQQEEQRKRARLAHVQAAPVS